MTSESVLPIRKQLCFFPGGGSAGWWYCSYCSKLVALSGQCCEVLKIAAPYYPGSWPFHTKNC